MKKIINKSTVNGQRSTALILASLLFVMLFAASCMDEWDVPNTANYAKTGITSPTDIGPVTSTIGQFKDENEMLFSQQNIYELMEDECVIEGIVVANDEGGNSYQSIYLADVIKREDQNGEVSVVPDMNTLLQLSLKNSCLYPFFQLGQRLKVNVKGLYRGTYSCVPKIGQPYKTSMGNWRLGPVLMELAKTHIYLEGDPIMKKNPDGSLSRYSVKDFAQPLSENDPVWGNMEYRNSPLLVTVEGYFQLGDTTRHLADYEEHDDGYGVNRDFMIGNSKKIAVRTSTQNDVAYIKMPPKDQRCRLTGILTYYKSSNSTWQLQICNKDCYEEIKDEE